MGERNTHETVRFGGKTYRKFICWPEDVTDGTVRCFSCGQIDEDVVHDPSLCPACQYTSTTQGEKTNG